jgi:uncharacterized protein (DUF2141 family)
MNRSSLMLLLAGLSFSCGPTVAPIPEPTITLAAGTGSIAASISNVKVGKGVVYCALFNSSTGFPGASPIKGGSTKAPADAATVTCRYDSLPSGDYAISIFQDENGNGQLDTNAFGAPTEGYGASQNVIPGASAPTFDANKVTVVDGQELGVSMTLH